MMVSLLVFVSLTAVLAVPLVQASQITKYGLSGIVPTGITINGIPSGLLAKNGYVYFPYGGGITRLDPATGSLRLYSLPAGPIYLDLSETYAWALTEGDTAESNYLYAVNLANGRTTEWHLVGNQYPAMNGLLVENDSSIWLTGTSLNHFDPNTSQMTSYPIPCVGSRCWTNASNIFSPHWADGKDMGTGRLWDSCTERERWRGPDRFRSTHWQHERVPDTEVLPQRNLAGRRGN